MKMSSVEDVVWELLSDEDINEHGQGGLPPGFRFHPTDEELLTFYLASKVLLMFDGTSCGIDIAEVDLNTCEPWDIPDLAKMGERQWCFFSLRDRKYPSGFRTNRATRAGHWKATGKDRQIYSATTGTLLGMKKTLVFYKGRAPSGEKTRWVMHEYRLHDHFRRTPCTEEWVICRLFHKIGKETNPIVFQDQSSTPLLETSAATTTAMVELSQSPSQIQRYISDMGDLNMLTNPILPQQNAHQINHLQPYFSPKPISPPHPNKNKHTYQPNTSIPKQCKTEANFTPFHLPYANLRCPVDNGHHGPFADKYSLLPGMDGVLIGFSSPAPDTTDTTNVPVVASTSMAFSGADMQP